MIVTAIFFQLLVAANYEVSSCRTGRHISLIRVSLDLNILQWEPICYGSATQVDYCNLGVVLNTMTQSNHTYMCAAGAYAHVAWSRIAECPWLAVSVW